MRAQTTACGQWTRLAIALRARWPGTVESASPSYTCCGMLLLAARPSKETVARGGIHVRREILSVLGAVPAADLLGPGQLYAQAAGTFPRRLLGRTGRTVVPLALGGQASLQWTKPGIDPADIIVRAVQLGLNYLDTANAYGPSQMNYGEAFRRLHLTPSDPATIARCDRDFSSRRKRTRRFARRSRGQRSDCHRRTEAVADADIRRRQGDHPGGRIPGLHPDPQPDELCEQVNQVYEGFAERGSRRPGANRRPCGPAGLPRRHQLHGTEPRAQTLCAAHRHHRPPELPRADERHPARQRRTSSTRCWLR